MKSTETQKLLVVFFLVEYANTPQGLPVPAVVFDD